MKASATSLKATMSGLVTPAVLRVILISLTLLAALGGAVVQRVAVVGLTNLIVVVGLYIFIGLSGVFSFGHIAFMAIGAYSAALLVIPVANKSALLPNLHPTIASIEVGPVIAVIAGSAVATVVAALFGAVLVRLSDATAPLGTFAFLIIVNVTARSWDSVTRGTAGIGPVPSNTTISIALACAVLTVMLAGVFQASRWGLRLRASREDPLAAQAIGVRLKTLRLVALLISAAAVGAGGALFAQQAGSFTPDALYLATTMLTIAMLVVGGLHSLTGAVFGTLVVTVFSELFRRIERGIEIGSLAVPARPGLRSASLAILLVVILIWRPEGLTKGRELGASWARKWARHRIEAPRPLLDIGPIPEEAEG